VTTGELVARWRDEAALYARDGMPGAALLRRVADELEAALGTPDERLVPYAEAAAVSGYSVAHLRRLVRRGVLRDQATTGPTLLAIRDLPLKPLRVRRPAALRTT
jgi:hypothetical protein